MKLDEYSSCDAARLAGLVRDGHVSPAEVRQCAGRAIDAINPQLHAVIEVHEDRLRDGDPDADPNGMFAAVPYLLKDIGAGEKGRLNEMGSRLFRGYRPDKDSFVTTRFKNAGLVNLGRTTTPEAGFAGTTESVATGRTGNPWNPATSPGGSSGGAAACVAAGIVPIAHGSDGAGSIRIPASLCGVVGLKPSRGRTSFGPDFDEPQLGCACEFVITRSVRDAAAMMDAIALPGCGDPFELPRPARSWLEESLAPQSGLRIAVSTTNWCTGKAVPEALARAAITTARDLEAMGHHVDEASPQFDAEIAYGANRIAFNSTLLLLQPFAAMLGRTATADTMEPVLIDAYRKMEAMTAAEFYLETMKFNIARRQIGAWFEHYDVLVTPTIAVPRVEFATVDCSSFSSVDAFREASERTLFTFTAPFNVTGQPAISLPLAQADEGTPIGVQLVGRFGREDILLRLATALEQVRPWAGRTPAVHAGRFA